jgi:hypothetical protein
MVLTWITEFVRGIPRHVNICICGGLCLLSTRQGEQIHKRRLKSSLPREIGLGILLFADARTPFRRGAMDLGSAGSWQRTRARAVMLLTPPLKLLQHHYSLITAALGRLGSLTSQFEAGTTGSVCLRLVKHRSHVTPLYALLTKINPRMYLQCRMGTSENNP